MRQSLPVEERAVISVQGSIAGHRQSWQVVCVFRGYRADSRLVRRVRLRADSDSVCVKHKQDSEQESLQKKLSCVSVCVWGGERKGVCVGVWAADSLTELICASGPPVCYQQRPKGCCQSSRMPTGAARLPTTQTHILKHMHPPCSTSAGGGTWTHRSTCTHTV